MDEVTNLQGVGLIGAFQKQAEDEINFYSIGKEEDDDGLVITTNPP